MTEKLRYDSKVREQRLATEMSMARKEREAYDEKRALGKKLERIQSQREQADEKMAAKVESLKEAGNDEEMTRIEKKK